MPDRPNGVVYEDGAWCAYFSGFLVAAGPDKAIIEGAYRVYADTFTEDEGDAKTEPSS